MQTEQTWRNLPAGPELDALIAERVLGWVYHPQDADTRRRADGTWRMGPPPYGGFWLVPPHPSLELEWEVAPCSTNPAAAWLVVEAMEARGWVPCLKRNIERVEWEATFWATPENPAMPRAVRIQADTAPLAICRAALAALEATQ